MLRICCRWSWVTSTVFIAALFAAGCDSGGGGGGGDVDGDADADADVDTDTDSDSDTVTDTGIHCDAETCFDGSTGLRWQRSPEGQTVTWTEATSGCEQLQLGGSSSWRLPTVTELGGLIKGCDKQSCDERKGPGEDGCYWKRNTWEGPCAGYWSSSEMGPSYPDEIWYVNFLFGGKFHDTGDRVGMYARCVSGG